MSTMRDPDAIISAWLDEGPTDLPEDTRHAIVVGTRAIRQRQPIWLPWRHEPMSPTFRFAATAAVAAVAIVALVMLVPRSNPGVGGPSSGASATASPTPSASPSPNPSPLASAPASTAAVTALPEAGPAGGNFVYPGTYTTHFEPALSLTVGREVELGCAPGFTCRGSVDDNLPGWLNLEFGNSPPFDVHLARLDKVFDPKHSGKLIDPPTDLATWVATLPGVTLITPPKSVKVGGLDATQFDLQSGDKGVTFGPIPGVKDPAFGFGPHQAHRIIVVNVHGRQIVMMVGVVDDTPGAVVTPTQLQPAIDALQPLIDSITWQ